MDIKSLAGIYPLGRDQAGEMVDTNCKVYPQFALAEELAMQGKIVPRRAIVATTLAATGPHPEDRPSQTPELYE